MSQLQSEVRDHVTRAQGATGFMGKMLGMTRLTLSQVNYRPKVLVRGAPSSLYSQLPDTADIQFAREMTEMQSEVGQMNLENLETTLNQSVSVSNGRVVSSSLRVNTRRAAGGASRRVSTLSSRRPPRLSLLRLLLSCRAR